MADESLLPDGMRSLVHPRRGGPVPASATVDTGAVRTVRDLTRDVEPALEDMFRSRRSYPESVEAVRAWLRGEPDPVGAAATASAVVRWQGVEDGPGRTAFVDAWAAEHGLPFAARAFTELCAVDAGPFPKTTEWVLMPSMTPDQPDWWWGGEAMLRMRTLLAAADDADYEEAVTRLAAHRAQPQAAPSGRFLRVSVAGAAVPGTGSQNPMIDPFRRLAVSYLVPTELAWMDECIAETDFTRSIPTGALQLLCSLTDAGQVDVPKTSHVLLGLGNRCPEAVATLAHEIGPAVVPVMRLPLRHHRRHRDERDVETRGALLDAAARLPYDSAFRLLADEVEDAAAGDALRTALDLYPERAARLLAPGAETPLSTGPLADEILLEWTRARGGTGAA
ncbi:hypothetical protein ACFHW2_02110 [Actinomadura sp. LOL_016]|uniref:hypothetical protein n=1 Tax=unclassified Actinomadura TaxID=2626254 RepID=UPI003A7FEB83